MCVCVCVYLILKCSNQLRLSWGMDEEVALEGGGGERRRGGRPSESVHVLRECEQEGGLEGF